MTGSRYFAEMLKASGLTHSFHVPTVVLPALREMDDIGLRLISVHGEKAAAYMADGYARAALRPGLCMAQAVGGANLAAGLKDAYMAGSPVIALTGGPYEESRFKHVYQEIRDYQMFDAVTKWHASIEAAERLPDLLRQAYRAATTGAPGPVHLEVRGHWGQAIEGEIEAEPVPEERFTRLPAFRPRPEPEAVVEVARALASAQRPVIVAGGGVINSGAEAELVQLAEKLSIPIATSLNAKSALPEAHPLNLGVTGLYSRRAANEIVSGADLVFFIGSRAGSLVTTNWRIPGAGARIVQLDIEPAEIGRHYASTLALLGDVKVTLASLIETCDARSNPAWIGRAEAAVKRSREEAQANLTSSQSPIRPERICAEIAQVLPADGAVVVDTLQASIWAGTMIGLKGPGQRFIRCAGSLGWGLPATIGVKCALGDRAVIGFTGDGGVYYHLAELETAARYGINMVMVVNNNGAYAGERVLWDQPYGGEQTAEGLRSWNFGSINFAQIAQEMGCLAIRVDRPEALADALQRGLASDRPVLIDVVSDPAALHPKGWTPS
ncbi:MAG TPA: thiamine pyrophosphate-binding protein [Candidatus Nitrosotalea sp.]|nr:thiamine pyrophosphate-binding protein [Candidatus Nitrosotalea sp.]